IVRIPRHVDVHRGTATVVRTHAGRRSVRGTWSSVHGAGTGTAPDSARTHAARAKGVLVRAFERQHLRAARGLATREQLFRLATRRHGTLDRRRVGVEVSGAHRLRYFDG